MTCFACEPHEQAQSPHRALCIDHKTRCVLQNGTLLSLAMRRAIPKGGPLEGNLLALVYNPVFVADSGGELQKGWTDFAAGGMAVFPSSNVKQQYMDFWLDARPAGVAVRSAVRGAPVGAERLAIESMPPDARFLAELAAGWFQRYESAAGRRNALGRWPDSFDELCDLLRFDEGQLRVDDAAFYSWLRRATTT